MERAVEDLDGREINGEVMRTAKLEKIAVLSVSSGRKKWSELWKILMDEKLTAEKSNSLLRFAMTGITVRAVAVRVAVAGLEVVHHHHGDPGVDPDAARHLDQ